MADQMRNGLRGVCQALRDVVAPAVTADDPLAQQELKMALRYLEFLGGRVDQLHARARFELGLDVELAERVVELMGDDDRGSSSLRAAAARGRDRLADPGAPIEALRGSIEELTEGLTAAVTAVQELSCRRDVEVAVLESSTELTAFERSWYLPLGLDHFGAELTPLSELLARSGQSG